MAQPLSYWQDTPTKQAILDFVDKVTADIQSLAEKSEDEDEQTAESA